MILLLLVACGPKVIITPNVDLRKYDRVGLIGFTCNAEGNMEEFVTRWLLMTLRKTPPKITGQRQSVWAGSAFSRCLERIGEASPM